MRLEREAGVQKIGMQISANTSSNNNNIFDSAVYNYIYNAFIQINKHRWVIGDWEIIKK